MKRKTKLAIVGCLLLVGIIVALVSGFRSERASLAFLGYTNAGTEAVFQVKNGSWVLGWAWTEERRSDGWAPTDENVLIAGVVYGEGGTVLVKVPPGNRNWRCGVMGYRLGWRMRAANWLYDVGVIHSISGRGDVTNYSAEIAR